MSDVWSNNDTGAIISDGTAWRYNRFVPDLDSNGNPNPNPNPNGGIGSFSFFDGTHIKYDAGLHVMETLYLDGADFTYNAGTNQYNSSSGAAVAPSGFAIALPAGASFSLTLNGTTISIDTSGNVVIDATTAPTGITLIAADGQIKLADLAFAINQLNGMINTFNAHTHDYLPGNGSATPTTAPLVPMV